MKVIFIKDLKGQGSKDEIREVKDGYAINYLIRNGYAVQYTDGGLKRLDKEINERKELDKEERIKCNKIKSELESKLIGFKLKTGEKDKVFGSISSKQIEEKLNEMGYKIDKKNIKKENLSSLGIHFVEINLYKDINAKLKIEIIKE